MSALGDGREVLCTLALPLPLTLAGTIGEALSTAAERAGYTDVAMLTDGTNRVVATKAPACSTCDWPRGDNEPVACPECGR